jgi:hypothetical protein
MPVIEKQTRPLLFLALRRRERAVAGLQKGLEQVVIADPTPQRADVEEQLRLCMVRYWPRVRDGRATGEDISRYCELLFHLAKPAQSDDLRFLDAWNNAFEALFESGRGSMQECAAQPFLASYRALLNFHIKRLDQ